MLELKTFSKEDISHLMNWINDERLCYQWSRGYFTYPLDHEQMEAYLKLIESEEQPDIAFIALLKEEKIPVGHIKISQVDFDNKTGMFQLILIGESNIRGKGLGRQLVSLGAEYAFNKMGLEKLTLKVFSFNQSAIRCYKSIGFKEKEPFECTFVLGNKEESWKGISMELSKNNFKKI